MPKTKSQKKRSIMSITKFTEVLVEAHEATRETAPKSLVGRTVFNTGLIIASAVKTCPKESAVVGVVAGVAVATSALTHAMQHKRIARLATTNAMLRNEIIDMCNEKLDLGGEN
jgi:hypothetical protein